MSDVAFNGLRQRKNIAVESLEVLDIRDNHQENQDKNEAVNEFQTLY